MCAHFRWKMEELDEMPIVHYRLWKAYWLIEPFGSVFDDYLSARENANILNQLYRMAGAKVDKNITPLDLMYKYKVPMTNEEVNRKVAQQFRDYRERYGHAK